MENEGNNVQGIDQAPEKSQSELVQLLSSFWQKIAGNEKIITVLRKTLLVIIVVLSILFIFCFFLYIVPGLQEMSKGKNKVTTNIAELKSDAAYKKQISQLGRDTQRLFRKFSAFTPGQSYLVINTTDNKFSLYRNKKLIREGFCSSGVI